jgi:hypothetical protein
MDGWRFGRASRHLLELVFEVSYPGLEFGEPLIAGRDQRQNRRLEFRQSRLP